MKKGTKETRLAASILGRRGGLSNKNTDKTPEEEVSKQAKILGASGGKKGGPARAEALTPLRRKQIAEYGSLCAKIKKGNNLSLKDKLRFLKLRQILKV